MPHVVNVLVRARVLHACRVTANDVVRRTTVQPSVRMPLHLCRTRIEHWRGEDRKHDGGVAEDTVLNDGSVLLHPRIQRHIVVLRPATQRREPQHRFFEALLFQLLGSVLHEQRMPIVDRIAQLENKDGIRIKLLELSLQLCRGEAILVHAVIVLDLLQHLDLPTHKPVPRLVDHLDVGMLTVRDAKGSASTLLLHVLVDLGLLHGGDDGTIGPCEGDRSSPGDQVLLRCGARLHNGNRHRDKDPVHDNVLVVRALQVLGLCHEPLQRGRPSLSEYVHPLQLLLTERQLRQPRRRLQQRRPLCRGHQELEQCRGTSRVDSCNQQRRPKDTTQPHGDERWAG
mmetsp:Transcript_6459/g.15962  ORF Transcript_6459/g.15962 Transcript_6459/m.15962 type:complete len:341 (+) Transcript_6459:348-1370(+)